jgi:hypothetical protein
MPNNKSTDPDAVTVGSIPRPTNDRVIKPMPRETVPAGGVRTPRGPKPVRDLTDRVNLPAPLNGTTKARTGR